MESKWKENKTETDEMNWIHISTAATELEQKYSENKKAGEWIGNNTVQ